MSLRRNDTGLVPVPREFLLNLGSYRTAPFEPWGWLECNKDSLFACGYTPDRLKKFPPYVNVIEAENFSKIGTWARFLLAPIEKLKKTVKTNNANCNE